MTREGQIHARNCYSIAARCVPGLGCNQNQPSSKFNQPDQDRLAGYFYDFCQHQFMTPDEKSCWTTLDSDLLSSLSP